MRVVRNSLSGTAVIIVVFAILSCTNAPGQVPQESPPLQAKLPPASPTDVNSRSAEFAPTDNQVAQTGGSDFSLLRTMGGFGLVLCLIVLAYVAARKFTPQYFVKKTAGKNLKLVESLAMGEKRSITIVEFDERRFLLGNTPNQITLLAELPGRLAIKSDVQPAAALTFAASRHQAAPESFKNIYAVERGTPPKTNGRHIPPDIRAKMRQLRESLER
jgi:flagellar biosynthetic protein FliO